MEKEETKICAYRGCEKEITDKRRKYCCDNHLYWENQCNKPQKGWSGQQWRLAKKEERFAKKIRSGKTGVRYN